MTKAELEQLIRSGIPLAVGMDFRVRELSETHVSISGGSAENINVHQTAFAGSLYALSTLAAWGLVFSRLPQNSELVMAEGNIRYRKPVVGEIVANCMIEPDTFEDFLGLLKRKGKARIQAIAKVKSADGDGAEFSGVLYARLEK